MPRSLLHTICSLAKYEKPGAPLSTQFLDVHYRYMHSRTVQTFIRAADRLIGYLLSYGRDISIGHRYFQPGFYRTKNYVVSFSWDRRNKCTFCSGCYYQQENECSIDRFSSSCPRFQTAWAVEHVAALTNRLVMFMNRKKAAVNA